MRAVHRHSGCPVRNKCLWHLIQFGQRSWASGLRAAIARPSIVVGASETGAIGRFENIYAFLKLIGSGRVAVLPTAPDASLDLVPIDHVINGLVDLVERFENAAGRTFHLVSEDPSPITELVALDYPGFYVPQLASSATFDPSRLDPLQTMIYENVTLSIGVPICRNSRGFVDTRQGCCILTIRRPLAVELALQKGGMQEGLREGHEPPGMIPP